MCDRTVVSLLELLEQERSFLLDGNIVGLANLGQRKDELVVSLTRREDLESDTLALLQKKVRRNHALLDAARSGLEAARDRILQIRKATQRLNTYTAGGAIRDLKTTVPSVERRS